MIRVDRGRFGTESRKLKVKNPNVKNSEPIIHSCILKCLAAIVRMDKYFIRRVTP